MPDEYYGCCGIVWICGADMIELLQIWDMIASLIQGWLQPIYLMDPVGWNEMAIMFKWFWLIWLSAYVLISWAFNRNIAWYHRLLIKIPMIQFMCVTKFKDGHRIGVILGMKQGHRLTGSSKKLKHGKILKVMKKAGM